MKKTAICLLLIIILIASTVFAGCSGGDSDTTDGSNPKDISKKRIEPTFMFRSNISSLTTDSLVFQYIGELTNIYFQPQPIPLANFKDKLDIILTSKDMPDLISIRGGKPIVMEYGPQGLFVSYTPYLDDGRMPNLKIAMDEVSDDSWKILTAEDGQIYGAPRIYTFDMLHESFMVRTDKMEEWGFDETFADPKDLTNFLIKAKQMYPDSTPVGNRWGGDTIIRGMAHQYWTDISITFDHDTDQYIYGPFKEGFAELIVLLNTWYTQGLLDPNWQSTSSKQWEENILNEKVFFVYDYMTESDRLTQEGLKTIEGFKFQGVVPFSGDPHHNVGMAESYHRLYDLLKVIPETSDYKEELVKFVDWCYSKEGINTVLYGKESIQYTVAGDGSIVLDPNTKTSWNPDGTFVASTEGIAHEFTAIQTQEYAFAYGGGPYQIAAWDAHKEAGAIRQAQPKPNYTDDQLDRKSQLETSVNAYMDELMITYIMGIKDISTWEAEKIILNELGVPELVEIYNAAYDATYR